MPRKPTKSSPATVPRGSSKRGAPDKATPTRQSKRSKATPAKSPYFEQDSDEEQDDQASEAADSEDYENESDSAATESDDVADDASDEDRPPKTRRTTTKSRGLPLRERGEGGGTALWKNGAKLVPGTKVVFKKPKPRAAGDVPYTPESIHPNTMLFLADLAANNDRQWLKIHDPDYRSSLQDFTTFLERLTERVVEVDETIPELPVKDIIFRIYRDVRFSKDPTPYKLLGVVQGAKALTLHITCKFNQVEASLYPLISLKDLHLKYQEQLDHIMSLEDPCIPVLVNAPKRSHLPSGVKLAFASGGGLWQPEAQALSKLRRDIDRKPRKIKRVLTDAGIRKAFFDGVGNDEKKAIKAFTRQSSNQSTALKKHPKGYENDHKDIELLRLRNFTLGTKLRDEEIVGPGGLDRIAGLLGCLVPFVTYLNSVVMPDEESSDSSEDEEAAMEDGQGADSEAEGDA